MAYAVGSSANTTTAYDGSYAGISISNASAGNTLEAGASTGTQGCVNYRTPPVLTISNGLAQLKALDLTFQGYVAPSGRLSMSSGVGQRFEGQIDSRYILTGQMLGRCAYDVSWRRSA